MGVYAKGMEMPKACKWCEYTSCEKRIRSWHIERADNCPLVEVPEPHGRLVDLDKMIEELWDGNSMEVGKIELRFIPTIIESEGE